MRSQPNKLVQLLDLAEVQQVEVGYCARCRHPVEITTDGPFGYGRTIERCTNRRCLESRPHTPKPDSTCREPKNPAFSRTSEYFASRTDRERKRRGAKKRGNVERLVRLPLAVDFKNL